MRSVSSCSEPVGGSSRAAAKSLTRIRPVASRGRSPLAHGRESEERRRGSASRGMLSVPLGSRASGFGFVSKTRDACRGNKPAPLGVERWPGTRAAPLIETQPPPAPGVRQLGVDAGRAAAPP